MMIATYDNRGAADKKDRRIGLVLGLSRLNIDRMIAGQPIHKSEVPLAVGGTAVALTIFFAETEADMQKMMGDFIGPDTIVQKDPKLS